MVLCVSREHQVSIAAAVPQARQRLSMHAISGRAVSAPRPPAWGRQRHAQRPPQAQPALLRTALWTAADQARTRLRWCHTCFYQGRQRECVRTGQWEHGKALQAVDKRDWLTYLCGAWWSMLRHVGDI